MEMDLNRLKNKVDSILANTNTINEQLKAICDFFVKSNVISKFIKKFK